MLAILKLWLGFHLGGGEQGAGLVVPNFLSCDSL